MSEKYKTVCAIFTQVACDHSQNTHQAQLKRASVVHSDVTQGEADYKVRLLVLGHVFFWSLSRKFGMSFWVPLLSEIIIIIIIIIIEK